MENDINKFNLGHVSFAINMSRKIFLIKNENEHHFRNEIKFVKIFKFFQILIFHTILIKLWPWITAC